MDVNRLVFAKKFILPSRAANALQSLTMAYAFAENGVPVALFPGFRDPDPQRLRQELERDYGLSSPPSLDLSLCDGRHKGIYGLRFRGKLLASWLGAGKGTVFYTRDVKEALLLARLKRLGLRRPLFFELHEILAEQHQTLGTGRAEELRAVEREILAQADGVIVISPLLAEDVKRVYAPAAPVLVSTMGYNDRLYTPIPPIEDLSGEVTLVYVGSLYRGKGVHGLVEALRHLPERFRLLVIGGQPEAELAELKTMAASLPGGPGRVEFTGHLAPRDLAVRVREGRIFIIPQQSAAEYFSPIKLYEALGLAMPMVVTPVPTIASVLRDGDCAVFARDTSPEALAAAIMKLADTPGLARAMQERCQAMAAAHTWRQRAADCLEFMRRTL